MASTISEWPRKRGSSALRISIALVAALLTSACATPVSVKIVNPEKVQQSLTRNVLSRGELSLDTRNLLRRLGADEYDQREPAEVLSVLHDVYVGRTGHRSPESQNALVALAEMAFHHASKTGDQRYFFSAVAYAWVYLFPSHADLRAQPIDPRFRLAIDLYNIGLSRAFTDEKTLQIRVTPELAETSFGKLDLRMDEQELVWGDRRLSSFISASRLEVRGLRNRYRWSGLGAPLSAITEPINPADRDEYLIDTLRVPVSAVLSFDDFEGELESGTLRAQLHLRVAYAADEIELGGQLVPLEMEPTSSFAVMLAETNLWSRELKGLFQGDLEISGDGISSLEPYSPGRIPVVLVHGTASSSARWADIVNDLSNDRAIRERYQFWLFTYNTGSPIAYSGWRLRQGILNLVDHLDPERKDPALHRIVVAGHSQGGLLTKLTAVESGSKFWDRVSDRPIEDMDLEPETREILGGSLFVDPVPEVERVVFISTPHRGSYLAEFGIARWMSRLVRAPANLVRAGTDFVSQDSEAEGIRKVERVDGAIGNMSPSSPFLELLIDMPVVDGVHSHSIISVKGGLAEPEESDGVVKYKSAHIDGVDSEIVVDSGHSCQSDPVVIAELRRILLVHLDENPSPVRRLFPE